MSQIKPARILLVDNNPVSNDLVRLTLGGEGIEVLQVQTAEEAFAKAVGQLPDVAIVEAVLPGMDGYALSRNLRQNEVTKNLPILMLSSKGEIADKVAGFDAGVDDYLTKPFEPTELLVRVRRLLARGKMATAAEAQGPKRGRIIAVFGTKGGVGKTTLSVNLAVALQRKTKARVALMDADFFFGDIALHLNLPPTSTVVDLVERIDQLDPELVERVMITHSSGVRVLLGPTQPEEAEKVTAAHVERLLDALSELYNFVIVDCHPNYDDRNLVILEKADDIMFVVRPELGPLKNMGVFLNLVIKLALPLSKIHIVLNRAGSRSGIEVEQIEQTFRRRIAFRMMSGGRTVVLSVNRGVPLMMEKPNHPLSKQISGMADYLSKQSPNGRIGGNNGAKPQPAKHNLIKA
jgi:pilus assembly protein CpaE